MRAVCQCGRDRASETVLVPCPWNNALCILIVGGHTDASLCVPLGCMAAGTRAREAMISENTATRVDQWQHADSPAGQPAIRDDEIGATETTRGQRMTGWDDGGGGERTGFASSNNECLLPAAKPSFSLLQPVDGSSFVSSNSVHTRLSLLLCRISYFR